MKDSELFRLFRGRGSTSQSGRVLALAVRLDQEIDGRAETPHAVSTGDLIEVLIISDGHACMNFFCVCSSSLIGLDVLNSFVRFNLRTSGLGIGLRAVGLHKIGDALLDEWLPSSPGRANHTRSQEEKEHCLMLPAVLSLRPLREGL